MLFTFAGSSHSNYTTYLLEFITNLELESSPALRDAILQCLLVNLTGHDGCWHEGDWVQEFFNRLLEDIVQRKGAEFDDEFIRDVISRNLQHFASLKEDARRSVGLSQHAGVHRPPGITPELRILLPIYRTEQIHYWRPTRQIDDRQTDNFELGIAHLPVTLARWIKRSNGARFVATKHYQQNKNEGGEPKEADGDSSESDWSDEETDENEDNDGYAHAATRGSITLLEDGQMWIDTQDVLTVDDDSMEREAAGLVSEESESGDDGFTNED